MKSAMTDILMAIAQTNGVRTSDVGAGLSRDQIAAALREAGHPVHPTLLDFYSQLNGMQLARAGFELWIRDLSTMLSETALEHLDDFGAYFYDEEEREPFAPFHVFAKHGRVMILVDLATLKTARSFDLDVEPLRTDLAETIEELVRSGFSADWERDCRV